MFGFFLRSLSWAQLAIIENSCLWNKFGKSLDTYTKLKIFPHCIRHPWSECPSPFTSGHLMNTLLICLFVCLFVFSHNSTLWSQTMMWWSAGWMRPKKLFQVTIPWSRLIAYVQLYTLLLFVNINRVHVFVWFTLKLPDQICYSPHCQPFNSYNISS